MSGLYQLAAVLALAGDSTTLLKIPLAPAESVAVTGGGSGSPVVLIPGLFGSAYGFRRVSALLRAAGYQVLVVEPLGIGWSSRPSKADYSLSAQAHRVAAALDSLFVRHAVVVAHSVGAGIAFRLAYQRPDLVSAAISLDGGPWDATVSPGLKRALRFAPLLRLFGGTGLIRRKVRQSLIQDSFDPTWVTTTAIEGYTAGAARDLGATLRAFQGMARSVEREPLTPHLREIRCPVLVLTGAGDRPSSMTPEERRLLSERIPAVRIDTVARSGHHLYEERPDAVVAAVHSLRLRPGGVPRRPLSLRRIPMQTRSFQLARLAAELAERRRALPVDSLRELERAGFVSREALVTVSHQLRKNLSARLTGLSAIHVFEKTKEDFGPDNRIDGDHSHRRQLQTRTFARASNNETYVIVAGRNGTILAEKTVSMSGVDAKAGMNLSATWFDASSTLVVVVK